MNKARRVARMLVRLALPVAAVLFLGTPETVRADRQTSCTYGFYTQYFDEFGNLCAASDTCAGWHWGDCDRLLTYASSSEDIIVCYCD